MVKRLRGMGRRGPVLQCGYMGRMLEMKGIENGFTKIRKQRFLDLWTCSKAY